MKKFIKNMKDNWQVDLPDHLNDIKSQLTFMSKKEVPFWQRNKLIFAPMSLIIICLFIFILVQQPSRDSQKPSNENNSSGTFEPTNPDSEGIKAIDTIYQYDKIIADQSTNFSSNVMETTPATYKIQMLARLSFTSPYLNKYYVMKMTFNDVDVTNTSMQFVDDFNNLKLKVSNDQFDIASSLKNSKKLTINYYNTIYHFIFTSNNYLMIELNSCYFFYKLPTSFNIANYFTN